MKDEEIGTEIQVGTFATTNPKEKMERDSNECEKHPLLEHEVVHLN